MYVNILTCNPKIYEEYKINVGNPFHGIMFQHVNVFLNNVEEILQRKKGKIV